MTNVASRDPLANILAFSMLLLAESPDRRGSLFNKYEGMPRVATKVKGSGFSRDPKRYQAVLLKIIPLQPSSSMQTSDNYQKILLLNPPIIALRKQPVATNKHLISVRGQSQPRCEWESASPDSAYLPSVILTAVRQN